MGGPLVLPKIDKPLIAPNELVLAEALVIPSYGTVASNMTALRNAVEEHLKPESLQNLGSTLPPLFKALLSNINHLDQVVVQLVSMLPLTAPGGCNVQAVAASLQPLVTKARAMFESCACNVCTGVRKYFDEEMVSMQDNTEALDFMPLLAVWPPNREGLWKLTQSDIANNLNTSFRHIDQCSAFLQPLVTSFRSYINVDAFSAWTHSYQNSFMFTKLKVAECMAVQGASKPVLPDGYNRGSFVAAVQSALKVGSFPNPSEIYLELMSCAALAVDTMGGQRI